jgi:hypothetical protein
MKHQKAKPIHDPRLSGSIQPDDGVDPRYDVRGFHTNRHLDRKAAQLCEQVRQALDFIVPDALQETSFDALVVGVQPAPNTGNLLVLLAGVDPSLDELQLHQAIIERAGLIRTAVAESIQRRKAPTLTFRVIRPS